MLGGLISAVSSALLRRRLLGMGVRQFGEFMANDPVAAAEVLRSIGDLLQATGARLVAKGDDLVSIGKKRRGRRVRRRGQQRLDLGLRAIQHAEDLLLRHAGTPQICLQDPMRRPL